MRLRDLLGAAVADLPQCVSTWSFSRVVSEYSAATNTAAPAVSTMTSATSRASSMVPVTAAPPVRDEPGRYGSQDFGVAGLDPG